MFHHNQDAQAVACEPGVSRKVLSYNDTMMVCEITFMAGAQGNTHAHPHTQVSYLVRGKLRFTIGNEAVDLGPGDTALVPPGTPHGVLALEDSLLVDVFHPLREDFV